MNPISEHLRLSVLKSKGTEFTVYKRALGRVAAESHLQPHRQLLVLGKVSKRLLPKILNHPSLF